jgi:signal peptide peptidase SppA
MLTHVAAHLMGVPLMIHRPKLDTILAVLGKRLDLPETVVSDFVPPVRAGMPTSAGIAVIPIYGTLVKRTLGLNAVSGLTSYQSIADQLDVALADPAITGIVLDIDSPGGEVNGAFDLADKIYAARRIKPICAIANDSAFSAAYAIASAASQVYVAQTGGVGSIGVIAMHVDQSARDASEGLSYTPIYAGACKNDLNPHEPLADSARDGLQREVDRLYQLFVALVARNRNLSAQAIAATEAGLLFSAEAVSTGFADGVASLDQVLAELTDFTQRPLSRGISLKEKQMAIHQPAPDETALTISAHAVGESPSGASNSPGPLTMDDAVEIAELCTLAGCPEATSEFLRQRSSAVTVRQILLNRRVQAETIQSHITPLLPAATGNDDVMRQAIERKIAQQTNKGV